MSVRAAGTSPNNSNTQSGPSIVSATLSSAATAEGTSRAPMVKSARPSPRLSAPKPKSTAICSGRTASAGACAAAKPAAMSVPRQTAGTMRTCEKRRTMTIVAENASVSQSASASPASECPPESASDIMMTMPRRTAAIAAQVAPATRSPSAAQAMSAAISGAPACTSRMLATVVKWSAMTKAVEALANRSATARPGSPIAPRDATAPLAPSRQSTKPKRKALAQTDRQKTIVHEIEPVAEEPAEGAAEAPDHRGAEDQPRSGA